MRRGPLPVIHTVQGNKSYQTVSATAIFQKVSFSAGMTQLKILNEADTSCEYSFNGTTVHGIVLNNSNDARTISNESDVWIRLTSGTGTVYVHAY